MLTDFLITRKKQPKYHTGIYEIVGARAARKMKNEIQQCILDKRKIQYLNFTYSIIKWDIQLLVNLMLFLIFSSNLYVTKHNNALAILMFFCPIKHMLCPKLMTVHSSRGFRGPSPCQKSEQRLSNIYKYI